MSEAERRALEPFERGGDARAESPYRVQHDLQSIMQELVGIVREEKEMLRALEELAALRRRAERSRADGNRQYNPGWHTALDLPNLLTVSEAVTRSALERRESRGAQFRTDHPDRDPAAGRYNIVVLEGEDGAMRVDRRPIPEMRADLKRIIEENG